MTSDTEQAFRHTLYCVNAHESMHTLHIGRPCPPALVDWIARYARTAWLITADNPRAEPLDEAINQTRRQLLETWTRTRALACLACVNQDPLGGWPDEHGLLIAGIQEGSARALGRRFGQLAIVAVSGNRPVELVWLNSSGSNCPA